MIRKPI